MQTLGLTEDYANDKNVRRVMYMAGALQHVEAPFWDRCQRILYDYVNNEFRDEAVLRMKLHEFLAYFKNQWLKLGDFFSLCSLPALAPFTTNNCENYHSHQRFVFRPGMKLGSWLHNYRDLQNYEVRQIEAFYSRGGESKFSENCKMASENIAAAKNLLNSHNDSTATSIGENYGPTDETLLLVMRQLAKATGSKILLSKKRIFSETGVEDESVMPPLSDTEDDKIVESPNREIESSQAGGNQNLSKIELKDEPKVVKEYLAFDPVYPWSDDPIKIYPIKRDGNCFYRAIAFIVYKNEESDGRVRKELMEFLLDNKKHSWIKYFGGLDGVEKYAKKYSKLGEWGSSVQLLLAAKRYDYNFVLYQPEDMPRFIPYFIDQTLNASAAHIGWIRFAMADEHFDVAQFGVKII